ncbi:MAG: PEGA domain-containing protein [Deltaproteobacteria bacterium]|nr:PEGA domain-containing protein [Deltaproteobacteria bacterium]
MAKAGKCFTSILVGFVLLLSLVNYVRAQGTREMNIWIPDPESEFVEEADRAFLGEMMRNEARRYLAFKLMDDPALEMKWLRSKVGCAGHKARCLIAVGRAAEADLMVYTSVQKLPGRFMVKMELVNLRQGKVVERVRRRAQAGREQLVKALKKGWTQLVGPLFRRQIRVLANVDGAEVMLDGIPVGSTPFGVSWELKKGSHVVSLTHPDFKPVSKTFRVGTKQKKVRLRLKMRFQGGMEDIASVPLVPLVAAGTKAGGKDEEDLPPSVGIKVEGKDEGDLPPSVGIKVGGKDEGDLPTSVGIKVGGKDEGDLPPSVGMKVGGKDEGDLSPSVGVKLGVKDGPGKLPEDGKVSGSADLTALDKLAFMPGGQASEPGDQSETMVVVSPFYKTWWFWTAVGAVVVAGTVTGTVLAVDGGGDGIPSGQGRLSLQF